MTASEFETVIKDIDVRFSVVPNENRPGLSNIFFTGQNYDLPVISSNDIREEIDHAYRYEFPNGMQSRYWTQGEVTERLKDFLVKFAKGKYADLYD